MSKRGLNDQWLAAIFALLSLVFLAAFRAGNRWGFEVPLSVRAFYLLVAIAFLVHHGVSTRGRRPFLRFSAAIAVISYGAELIGVQSGWLFGTYEYGNLLGPMLPGGVPIGIPIFWMLLLYAADDLVGLALGRQASRWLRVLAVGAVAASWDLMIDPIAVAYGCWSWSVAANEAALVFGIPPTNALCWWVVGSLAVLVGGSGAAPAATQMSAWVRHLPALALVAAALNNVSATFELGFAGAGVAGGAALCPYVVAAVARWPRVRT